ncbi:MAG: transketolase, partial [Calditrichaeota bacterium]|nr:transketolase [Calditrichota bacterium]
LVTYQKAVIECRKNHIPAIIHVKELTQPQGHSTSGSHERYKSKERLKWEADFDCIRQFRLWLESKKYADKKSLDKIETEAKSAAKAAQQNAWTSYRQSIDSDKENALKLLNELAEETGSASITDLASKLSASKTTFIRDVLRSVKRALYSNLNNESATMDQLRQFIKDQESLNFDRYNSYLYSQSAETALNASLVEATYQDTSQMVDGREVLQACFDYWLSNDARVFAIGEDVGKIGDVNKAFEGMQEKHGELRVTDTGIREVTIIGQGIGAAMRGLKPIVEIQYLDYILYATQILSDDLATLQYRTKGGQKAPLIIRTRGHRLEGIWHSGSPMGHLLSALHGIYILVPRNMTQAAGFYNTMLNSDDPAIIVECLNGYRLKEKLPNNIGQFKMPLGIPETLVEGSDITVVSYGSTLRIIEEALNLLADFNISVELIDVQTLIPFDINHQILQSIKKTNRVLFVDEDMPGAATAYMMREVIDKQNAWEFLDSKPVCLSAKANRPAYGTDGDYFCKPNAEDVFETIYQMMHEYNPAMYPALYK